MTRAAGDRIGLAHHVLDHQLVDVDGRRCGKVDDVTLDVDASAAGAVVSGVLTGPGVLRDRVGSGWLRWLVGLAGAEAHAVPWRDVAAVTGDVRLAVEASSLGLSPGEDRAGRWLERVLGPDAHAVRHRLRTQASTAPDDSSVRLTSLLGRHAVDRSGARLGRVHELVVEKSGPVLSPAAGAAWVVVGALVGATAVEVRLGLRRATARTAPIVTWPTGAEDPFVLGDHPAGD